jgi:hypothetical protein
LVLFKCDFETVVQETAGASPGLKKWGGQQALSPLDSDESLPQTKHFFFTPTLPYVTFSGFSEEEVTPWPPSSIYLIVLLFFYPIKVQTFYFKMKNN